jgi:hypothetical protein
VEPAVRVTRPQSGITSTPSPHLDTLQSQLRLRPRSESAPARRPERNFWHGRCPTQTCHRTRRPKSGNWIAESPRRNDLFGVLREMRGSQGMMETIGSEPVTHHPVIKLVSTRAGNGNYWCGDELANRAFCQAETARRDRRGCEKSPFWRAINAKRPTKVSTQRLGGGRTRARTWDPMIKSQLPLRPSATRLWEGTVLGICHASLGTSGSNV